MIALPSSRLPNTGTTIFTLMSALATEQNAVNLSQGFPDFPIDETLTDSLIRAVQEGKNQYAPMAGTLRLRQNIAHLNQRIYGLPVNPQTEVTITSGATEALFDAITAVVRPGDEVIILEPCYDSYLPAIVLNGGIPISVSLNFPEYSIPWDKVESAMSAKTRLIILNSPHNPTGAILRAQDMENLILLTRNYPVWIISDEVYEHICFDGNAHESVLKYPELAARSFKISSFGKTFHVTGWKVGYCIAPPALTDEFRKIHQYVTFTSPTPFQEALADMMEQEGKVESLSGFYQEKRDYFLENMKPSAFIPLKTSGTYFQLMDYSAISDMPDTEFAIWLTREHKVASIPVSVFYQKAVDRKVVRFCFAKKTETLDSAIEKLCRI